MDNSNNNGDHHIFIWIHCNNMVYISGSKKDVWIAIDPATGAKIQTLSSDGAQKVCPSSTDKLMYIGRTGL